MTGAKDHDDFAAVYEPLSKDGAFIPFRPPAPEDMQEPLKIDRFLVRYTPVVAPKIRRLVSVARSREALRQREESQALPLAEAKKVEDECHRLHVPAGYAVEFKPDVDTEAEDSEVSTTETCNGRPTFRDYSRQAPDGCLHLIVPSKGPLYAQDEPPDFLQLPEPIKQRTAGAARVAAAARAWAAASAQQHPNQQELPATARGAPSPQHAALIEELRLRGPNGHGQASVPPASPQADPLRGPSNVENREVVAGPAVLALRHMRNQMSALAEGRLPWNFTSRGGDRGQERRPNEHVPSPPSQPPSGSRRPLLPNLGRVVASAAGGSSAPQAQPGASQSSAAQEAQMQSLVPAPPNQPKPPNSANSRFWRRPWPRMNIMNSLGWGGSSSSNGNASSSQDAAASAAANAAGAPSAQASGEQSRPGTQATASVGHRHGADPTPSSGSSAVVSPP